MKLLSIILLSVFIAVIKTESYDLLVRYLRMSLPANSAINIFCNLGPTVVKNLLGQRAIGFGQLKLVDGEILVYCVDENGPQLFNTLLSAQKKLAYKNTWLIFGSEMSLNDLEKQVTIVINMKMYFLNANKGEFTERYRVGNVSVTNYLGINASEDQGLPSLNALSESYLKRRSDFKGMLFRAVAHSASSPTIFYSKEVLGKVQ